MSQTLFFSPLLQRCVNPERVNCWSISGALKVCATPSCFLKNETSVNFEGTRVRPLYYACHLTSISTV